MTYAMPTGCERQQYILNVMRSVYRNQYLRQPLLTLLYKT